MNRFFNVLDAELLIKPRKCKIEFLLCVEATSGWQLLRNKVPIAFSMQLKCS